MGVAGGCYFTMCCCGCRLRSGVLLLAAITFLDSLAEPFKAMHRTAWSADAVISAIWAVVSAIMAVYGFRAARRCDFRAALRFQRFLFVSMFADPFLLLLGAVGIGPTCQHAAHMGELPPGYIEQCLFASAQAQASEEDVNACATQRFEDDCTSVLAVIFDVQLFYKLLTGVYFYWVVASFVHALRQFGTDAIVTHQYPISQEHLQRATAVETSSVGMIMASAVESALAPGDEAMPPEATVYVDQPPLPHEASPFPAVPVAPTVVQAVVVQP